MAISVVQTGIGYVNDGTSFNLTLSSTPTSGNKLLAILSISKYQYDSVPSISDFSTVGSLAYSSSSVYVLTKTAGESESTTYSVSLTGPTQYHSGIIYEISGADNDDFFDAIQFTNSLTSPSVVPSVIGVLPITALGMDGNRVSEITSAPSGWDNLIEVNGVYFHGTFTASASLGTDTVTSYSAVWPTGDLPVTATMLINPASAVGQPISKRLGGIPFASQNSQSSYRW